MMNHRATFIPTPEIDLLLACARLHMDAPHIARVRRLAADGVDWATIYRLAQRHGVLPLTARHLPQLALPNLPDWLIPRLEQDHAKIAQHNLLRARGLTTLAHHLRQDGIPALFYKGALNAATLYGDLALRPFGDVDLLIRPESLPQVVATLPARGYASTVQRRDLAQTQQEHNEWSFTNPTTRLAIDLHWRVSPATFAPLLHEDDLWARNTHVELLPGAPVTTLCPHDQLLVLAVHAAKSCWSRLKWIGDFAAWLHSHTDWDWATTLADATRLGCRRILLTSLYLAHRLFDAVLPPPVCTAINDDPQTPQAARTVAAYLWQQPSPFDSVFRRYFVSLHLHPRLFEQPRHRIHYLTERLRHFVSPNERDREARPLPAHFQFVYWLVRPWRLWKTYGMGGKQ